MLCWSSPHQHQSQNNICLIPVGWNGTNTWCHAAVYRWTCWVKTAPHFPPTLSKQMFAAERLHTDGSQQLCSPGGAVIFYRTPRYAVENMHIHVQYGRPQRGQMCERCSVLHRNHFIDESCCQGPNIPGPWAEQEDECLTGCNYSCKQQAAARQSSTEQTQNIFVWLKQLVQEIRSTAGLCEFDSV